MFAWCKNLIALMLLIGFIGTGIWLTNILQDPALFPVTTIKVQGRVQHVNQDMLSNALMRDINQSFFTLDVHQIKARVQRLPWVADVIVQRVWPYTLKLTIREQIPVAIWNWSELINQQGERFQAEDLFAFADLPILLGKQGYEKLLLEKLAALQTQFNVNGLRIREIQLDPRFSWRLTLQNGIQVKLSQKTQKDLVLQFIHAYVRHQIVNQENISLVDLRYQNGFSVRWASDA